MQIDLSVSRVGFEVMQARLNATSDQLNDLDGILDESAAILLSAIRQRFLDMLDPDLVAWLPSAAGLKRQAQGGPGTGYDTGQLWRSIQLFSAGSNERAIGTDRPYGPWFQSGVHHRVASGHLEPPVIPRIFLGFGASDEHAIETFILNKFNHVLGE